MSQLLGPARVSDDELAEIVGVAVGRPVEVDSWKVGPVGYESLSPGTGALLRVRGTTTDGQDWSVFVKVLQHVRHWPLLHLIPSEHRSGFVADFPWRSGLTAWEPDFVGRLPAGMRVPALYRLAELGDDRVAVWMEDVRCTDQPWSVARFARAARLLGGLSARRCDETLLAASPVPAGHGLRMYFHSRVVLGTLPALDDDDLWQHAELDAGLRADLRTLADRAPALLDRLDTLPQAYPHGDASPQNLLVPADDPDGFVAIDISFQAPHVIGFDLGQLLVGLVHSGEMPAAALPEVHAVLVPEFVAGLREHGVDVPAAEVAFGYEASLVLRAGFTSIPYERFGPGEDNTMIRERVALTRFIADLGLALD